MRATPENSRGDDDDSLQGYHADLGQLTYERTVRMPDDTVRTVSLPRTNMSPEEAQQFSGFDSDRSPGVDLIRADSSYQNPDGSHVRQSFGEVTTGPGSHNLIGTIRSGSQPDTEPCSQQSKPSRLRPTLSAIGRRVMPFKSTNANESQHNPQFMSQAMGPASRGASDEDSSSPDSSSDADSDRSERAALEATSYAPASDRATRGMVQRFGPMSATGGAQISVGNIGQSQRSPDTVNSAEVGRRIEYMEDGTRITSYGPIVARNGQRISFGNT